jgi:hypothetical protein
MDVIDEAKLAAAMKGVTDPLMTRLEALVPAIAQQVATILSQGNADASGLVKQATDALGPRIDALETVLGAAQGNLASVAKLAEAIAAGQKVKIEVSLEPAS